MRFRFKIIRRVAASLVLTAAVLVAGIGTALAQIAPAIWKMGDEDTTIYITGTIHLMTPETRWFNDELRARFDAADNLVLEYNMQDQSQTSVGQLMREEGMLPAGDSLRNYFSEQTYQKILDLLAELPPEMRMPTADFERFRPWLAMLQLTAATAVSKGFLPQFGVDLTFMTLAGRNGMTVLGLESAEFQIRLFSDLPDEEAADLIESGLPQLDELEATFIAMRDHWLAGEMTELAAIMNEGFADDDSALEIFLYQRNRNWRDQLIQALEEPGIFFVAVGAGHLAGDQNLISLLKEAGFEVTRE